MSLLHLAGNRHAAFAAPEKAEKRLWNALLIFRYVMRSFGNDGLHLVEKLLGYDGLVLAFIKLAGITEMTVINGIAENASDAINAERIPASVMAIPLLCEDAVFGEKLPHVFESLVSLGVFLKRLFDNRRKVGINDDGFGRLVVQIPGRRYAGEMAHLGLVHQPASRVAAELVAVLLGLNEFVAEIGFTLWRVFKPEGREFQIRQETFVEKIDDLAAVLAVPGQAVRMPGDDARSFAHLDPLHHGIEQWPSWDMGGFFFPDSVNDGQVLLLRQLFQGGKLAGDG